MTRHDLIEFLKRDDEIIAKEYERICSKAKEDPGTAGDQGEENWKRLLEGWLPPYFKVVTKGRIIDSKGVASPQLDVVVLAPEYPKQMLNSKLYMSSGVVAAFECKTTLKKSHIEKFMKNSKCISSLALNEKGTPRKDLQSKIYYGLLAHSHSWKKQTSQPIVNIKKAIEESCLTIIKHPIEIPNIVCVANLAALESHKLVIPPQPRDKMYSELTVRSSFIEPNIKSEKNEDAIYTSVGAFIFSLLEHLAWRYPSLRDNIKYMRDLQLEGSGKGKMLMWPYTVLSGETLNNLHKLKNGVFWDEWNMHIK